MEAPPISFSFGVTPASAASSNDGLDLDALSLSSDSLAHRRDQFKAKAGSDSQSKRREEFLKRQKQAREDMAERIRQLAFETAEEESTAHFNTPEVSPEPPRDPPQASAASSMQVWLTSFEQFFL